MAITDHEMGGELQSSWRYVGKRNMWEETEWLENTVLSNMDGEIWGQNRGKAKQCLKGSANSYQC